jgi:PBP1b-binding outer membrane lipoprotein LpoB
MISKHRSFAVIGLAGFFAACATTPKVTRVDVNETIDLSGDWNDTDSRQVAEEMVKDSLARPWLGEFQADKKLKPRVIVGLVGNKSSEHINRGASEIRITYQLVKEIFVSRHCNYLMP